MSFLDDVQAYLVAEGAGSGGWPIYVGYLPDDQDQTISLFPTGGMPADTLGRENRNPKFQLRVRAARLDYATCFAKWQQVFNLLQDARQISGSPVLLPNVVFIQAQQDEPFDFPDDKGRHNMTTNFRCKTTT
jgi:Bacteriophage minor capsid protein